jgi:hypothetical protein
MKGIINSFLVTSLGLVALFLILSNYTGFGKDVSATSSGLSTVYTTLQGRG